MALVLLIDDDDQILTTLKMGLEKAGHVVTKASGGIEGLKLIKSQQVDVVVTDIIMKDGEGMETLRWIKENSPGIPVIGISGYFQYLDSFKKLGGVATLKKPFKIEKLIETIREVTRS